MTGGAGRKEEKDSQGAQTQLCEFTVWPRAVPVSLVSLDPRAWNCKQSTHSVNSSNICRPEESILAKAASGIAGACEPPARRPAGGRRDTPMPNCAAHWQSFAAE